MEERRTHKARRPDWKEGDKLRHRGTAATGYFVSWHGRWDDFFLVRLENALVALPEPIRDWRKAED